jgi:hypothetical protein
MLEADRGLSWEGASQYLQEVLITGNAETLALQCKSLTRLKPTFRKSPSLETVIQSGV